MLNTEIFHFCRKRWILKITNVVHRQPLLKYFLAFSNERTLCATNCCENVQCSTSSSRSQNWYDGGAAKQVVKFVQKTIFSSLAARKRSRKSISQWSHKSSEVKLEMEVDKVVCKNVIARPSKHALKQQEFLLYYSSKPFSSLNGRSEVLDQMS